jgi:hypothetical protein
MRDTAAMLGLLLAAAPHGWLRPMALTETSFSAPGSS